MHYFFIDIVIVQLLLLSYNFTFEKTLQITLLYLKVLKKRFQSLSYQFTKHQKLSKWQHHLMLKIFILEFFNTNCFVIFPLKFYFLFHPYIYPPESQENNKDTIHRASTYADLFTEMPRFCYLAEIFI